MALREFGRRLTYVSSFGAESAAMLGLISEVDPEMPIVFIDTGMHFHQTLQYRDTLSATLGLTDIRTFHPVKDEVKAVDPKGVLNKTDPERLLRSAQGAPAGPGAGRASMRGSRAASASTVAAVRACRSSSSSKAATRSIR